MKNWPRELAKVLVPAILLLCALQGIAQQKGALPDPEVFAAAQKAFTAGNWNPEIFEALPNLRTATVDTRKPVLRSLLLLFFFFKEEQEEQTQEVPAAQRFPRVPLAGTKRNKRHIR